MAGTIRAHSPPTPPSLCEEPAAKRVKVSSVPPVASTSALPYGKGLHLAPMVRIGTLPTRLIGKYTLATVQAESWAELRSFFVDYCRVIGFQLSSMEQSWFGDQKS